MSTFPTDDATLLALRQVCTIAPGDTRTRLSDFLAMGEVEHGRAELAPGVWHVQVTGGWSPHDVILALVAEVERLRGPLQPRVLTPGE